MEVSSYILLVPFIVAFIIQLLKLIIDAIKHKNFYFNNLLTSGGFPSVHSWVSVSAVTLAYLEVGPQNIIFVVTVVFMFLFVYDAVNIRYEAWKHAHYLNSMRTELWDVLQTKERLNHLKERLWHTPLEVLWGVILWSALTVLLYQFV